LYFQTQTLLSGTMATKNFSDTMARLEKRLTKNAEEVNELLFKESGVLQAVDRLIAQSRSRLPSAQIDPCPKIPKKSPTGIDMTSTTSAIMESLPPSNQPPEAGTTVLDPRDLFPSISTSLSSSSEKNEL
jgi:hypothetical protein